MGITEVEYLGSYDIGKYDRPSAAVDIAAFSVLSDEAESYKHNSDCRLALLLVKRGVHPFKGQWALPGGFLRKGETLAQCAMREIKEETGVSPLALMPAEVFSEPSRDPRGWILSHSFVSVMSEAGLKAVGGDDAEEARWFALSFSESGSEISLTLDGGDAVINARLIKTAVRFKCPQYEVADNGGLAFDHAEIVACALAKIRGLADDFEVLFDFLPEKFTLAALQQVQEVILGTKLAAANFRRKAASFIVETDEYVTGAGHRPAKLYMRKQTEETL